ncbi:RDD family protein, partial [Vibrio cholerae]|nr:RDD family protein [Vibrio cholerae]EJP6288433.1 RDD family protein [Vibrio cholerae]
SLLGFFIGFFWIFFNKKNQGWHDKIAKTIVIKLPSSTQ